MFNSSKAALVLLILSDSCPNIPVPCSLSHSKLPPLLIRRFMLSILICGVFIGL